MQRDQMRVTGSMATINTMSIARLVDTDRR